MTMPRDASLMSWTNAEAEVPRSALLMGNGASMAVWRKFSYPSLHSLASTPQTPAMAHPMDPDDVALFQSMRTTNFEQVLGALLTTESVTTALRAPLPIVRIRYDSIQTALVEAVHRIHIPWDRLPDSSKDAIRSELLQYAKIFTTNYDLIVYWSIMSKSGAGFKDYFWSDFFDVSSTEIWDKTTVVHYLHGGLHLVRTPDGRTMKRRADQGKSLLDTFGQPINGYPGAHPLFISEGTAQEKLASIYKSDYLAFVYAQLASYSGHLCIFGLSLDDTDDHLRRAILRYPHRKIAIAIRPGSEEDVISTKARFRRDFPVANLHFFDSTTHPLGDPSLLVS